MKYDEEKTFTKSMIISLIVMCAGFTGIISATKYHSDRYKAQRQRLKEQCMLDGRKEYECVSMLERHGR